MRVQIMYMLLKMMTFDDVFAFSIFLRAELLSNEYLLRTENSV